MTAHGGPTAGDRRRPHVLQAGALARLGERLAVGGRGVVVMPCGSGKTLLGRWFAEQVAARLVVVCVPTLALVPQTLLAYRSQSSWPHTAMVVCSDPTSGRAVALADLELPDWVRAAVTASTSTRRIGEFLTGPTPGARLVISTYHSAPRVATALRATGRAADLLVCDEAHRLTGRPREEFRTVLDDGVLPADRRLFLTATAVEAAAWEADTPADDTTAPLSLDDEHVFGPQLYRATFADAVAAGRLVDYDVHVLAVRGDGGDEPERPGAAAAVLTAAADGACRILTFHSRVSHARDLAGLLDGHRLPDGRVVRAEHLEAGHRAGRRAAALDRLADPGPGVVAVLASARVLTEGVDVPAVDTVVFAEPRTSPVDIVQAVGRAMRTAPGKARGRVVLAVTTGRTGMDEDTELCGTRWRHVWTTLRALASMDPRFAAQLRARITPGDTVGGRSAGPGLRLDLPDGLDPGRWMLRALDRTGGSWWHHYDQLAAHTLAHGHARPSVQTRHGGAAIGRWVAYQRTLHRQGVLGPERVDALQELPGWAWNAHETAWWRAAHLWTRQHRARRAATDAGRWARLVEASAWGADPPKYAYDNLAQFAVDTCARRRRRQLPTHLERAAGRLPAWQWDLTDPGDARMLDALAEYVAWKRDLNAPHDYVHDGALPVGAWLTAVRRRQPHRAPRRRTRAGASAAGPAGRDHGAAVGHRRDRVAAGVSGAAAVRSPRGPLPDPLRARRGAARPRAEPVALVRGAAPAAPPRPAARAPDRRAGTGPRLAVGGGAARGLPPGARRRHPRHPDRVRQGLPVRGVHRREPLLPARPQRRRRHRPRRRHHGPGAPADPARAWGHPERSRPRLRAERQDDHRGVRRHLGPRPARDPHGDPRAHHASCRRRRVTGTLGVRAGRADLGTTRRHDRPRLAEGVDRPRVRAPQPSAAAAPRPGQRRQRGSRRRAGQPPRATQATTPPVPHPAAHPRRAARHRGAGRGGLMTHHAPAPRCAPRQERSPMPGRGPTP